MARRDNRLYAQLTLDYLDSHKIAILSDSAIVAHVRMILWSRRLMTDGRIPEKMALHLAKKRPKILSELTSNDPDAPSLVKVGSDYILHDFSEHQTTRADIERQTQVNTENGKRGGRPKGNRSETEPVSESEPKESQRQSTETETISSSTKKRTTPASRGTRMFSGWVPPADEIARAKSEYAPSVDLKAENEVFVDYWISAAGVRGVKADWVATWRNWMKRKESDSKVTKSAPRTTAARKNMSTVEYFEAQERMELEA